ncbi:MAG: substrate-binding domain-containing protein [Treponema sp.]|nr:substrate-binding domain-containing protein [Treponema sp.]
MKKTFLVVLALFLALICFGCSKPPAAPQAAAAVDDRSNQLYIEVSALGNLEYFYDHMMGMRIVGEELGVRTEYVGPADYDMNAMVAAFEQAIARRPQGIVVVGFEDSLNPIVQKSIDAGIPVVTVDADLPDSARIAFVGTGNFNAGVTGGEYLANLLGGRGSVALLTQPGQSNLEERLAGYRQALGKYPGIEIVQVADSRSDPVIAAQAASALLQRFPNLSAIACVESAGGAGSATAVREAGLVGKVTIMSFDRGNDVIAGVEEGIITASIVQQTALMPYYATQILYNLANSNVEITTNNAAAGVAGIPQVVDTGAIIMDKNNARYFKR